MSADLSKGFVPRLDSSRDAVLLSVVVPVYNEAATVEDLLRRVRRVPLRVEVIAVDDASTDGTREILRRLEGEGVVDRLLLHERNLGKGAALQNAFDVVRGALVVVQDADLEYDPQDIPDLLGPILAGRAEAVFGSRFLGTVDPPHLFWHALGNRLLTSLSNVFTGLGLTDMETCYKVVRADLLATLPLRARRFGIEPELTARLAQAKARVREVPIRYHGRSYSEGKKIGWKDGIAALWHIVRSNLFPPRARPWKRPDRAPWEV